MFYYRIDSHYLYPLIPTSVFSLGIATLSYLEGRELF